MIGKSTTGLDFSQSKGEKTMKYIVVLGDGMADEPLEALGGKTPLEYAQTPCMDSLASMGHMGLVQNVPSGMGPWV